MNDRLINSQEQTRTIETELRYSDRGEKLYDQYVLAGGDTESWGDLHVWAQIKANSLRPSAWRQYRASIKYFVSKIHSQETTAKVNDILSKIRPERRVTAKRTSSHKKKNVDLNYLIRLLKVNQESTSQVREFVHLMCLCTIYVGLRPKEWATAQLIVGGSGRAISILVNNGKATNKRACGTQRKIHLGDVSETVVKTTGVTVMSIFDPYGAKGARHGTHIVLINRLLKIIEDHGAHEDSRKWNALYASARQHLRRQNQRISNRKKQYITFYSCRHQFSADIKANGYTKIEQAALLGHAVDDTAEAHYGRRRSGVGISKVDSVKPSKENMALVTESGKTNPHSKTNVQSKEKDEP